MEKSLLLHRNSQPRRGGWVAETNSLLNCRIPQGVPGVRIPPSPRKKEDDGCIVFFFGVWRSPASAPALGAGGRRFESFCPDKMKMMELRKFVTPSFFRKNQNLHSICTQTFSFHQAWTVFINENTVAKILNNDELQVINQRGVMLLEAAGWFFKSVDVVVLECIKICHIQCYWIHRINLSLIATYTICMC